MKKTLFVLFFCVIASFCFAEGIAEEARQGNEKADLSYALGMIFASDLKQYGIDEVNYSAFSRGFREFLENQKTRYTLEEAFDLADSAIWAIMAERAEIGLRQETEFLAENATKPGVYTTASGLQYEIIVEGTGRQPEATDYVRVHYTGYLLDGTVFDSSYTRGEPEEFPLQGVIPGWIEGLKLMHEGGKSRLYIPSRLAYGTQGVGSIIPPNSLIIFDVEFLEIVDSLSDYYWYDDDDYYWYDDDYYWWD